MTAVGVLGNGITATAVRDFLSQSKNHHEVALPNAEMVITSPGIPQRDWPKLAVPMISDVEFAVTELRQRGYRGKVVGITGTNGKTTVTSAIAHALNVTPFGNIGQPLINQIDAVSMDQPLILELSSYQLASSKNLQCDIAVITNIEPDHLEWHETMAAYEAAKFEILSENQVVFMPEKYVGGQPEINAKRIAVESLEHHELPQFIGRHNKENLAMIIAVLNQLGMSPTSALAQLASFQLPAFRCEPIHNKNGLLVINDSKATNMAATQAAVASFPEQKLLILAGQPKAAFEMAFLEEINQTCHTIFAAGALAKDVTLFPEKWRKKIVFFETLKAATHAALRQVGQGMILFSPAAASFDEFLNFEDRGRAFTNYVKEGI